MEPMKLMFTSYRDSIGMEGLKVSIERYPPKPCAYPILSYLVMPPTKNLTTPNAEQVYHAVLNNNWDLVRDFICEIYALGIHQIVLCCWCTKEQIIGGNKACAAGVIGRYIQAKADENEEFVFPIEFEYRDGREVV